MISMQRSLSSPVRIRSEPPVSPALEHTPRAPTPAHETDIAASTTRARSRSRSRITESSHNRTSRRSEDVTRRARQHHQSPAMSSSRRPIVEQPSGPSPGPGHSRHGSKARPVTPPPRSDNPTSKHPRSLLQDVSLYTNSHLTRDNNDTTLEELAHIVRLSKYQERKRANTRTRLQRSLVSTALSARLTRCGDIAHRNLVDCFRRDDKDSFAALYNAIHDVRRSCDERRRYSLFEPDMQSLSSPILGSSESLHTPTDSVANSDPLGPSTPFLQEISASARDTLLDFLTQIRTNPDYLATRICALSSSELKVFLSFHKDLEPVESVLPSHGRSGGRPHASASARSSNNVDIERLLSFQRHDPLSVLIHTCFANSAGPDSSEDQRRTDIWATVMARLISEFKSTGEHFLISVLNIWTTMRDWSGKSNMEWYLMKILKDGAFLLELAEDQHGTRFNLSDWNQSDELAEKRFYDKAVEELFEMVDDDDATGIPEGLLELGNAILGKLDSKYVENASRWLVWRCLFFVFFLGVIIHPESHGMLVDYHITPYAREKILKKVAMRAHEYVSSMWSGKPSATDVSVEIPATIKGHLESVLARFQGSRSKVPSAKLLPARSITSLRETVEVHPYLVLSPADLVTIVNALFPERRPMSSASFRSGSASLSNMSAMSQPIPTHSAREKIETPSVISTSAGSIVSDATTSREGFFDDPASFMPQRYSPPSVDQETLRRQGKYEDDGYKLRLALHELQQTLGHEVTRGTCHPCAERWMVLFVSADGKTLTTQMTYDPETDQDEEDNSSTTDTDEDDTSNGPQMDKDYLQLRDSVLKLVEDYEIPHNLEPETPTTLSNRASGLKRYKSKNKIITPEKSMSSRNPYRKQAQPDVQSSPEAPTRLNTGRVDHDEMPEPTLVTMLKSASSQSKSQADFVSSHMYWKTLKQLNALESASLREDGYAALINIFSRGPKDSIRRSAAAIEEYDAWLVWLKQSQERHEGLIDRMMRRVRSIRDKMWYVTDVRNSKVYEHSRKVCQALKTMGTRRRNSFQRSRNSTQKSGNSAYLYRAESQIMDLLAATEDQGGPNKLSDDQAEKTALWLQQRGIVNLCAGEERMHRFSYEVDQCISMLVGENIREAPVLWSSELYKRDKIVYDRLRAREREQSASGDDAASIISDSERRYGSSSGKPGSLNRDLRNISLNTTGHSFDSRHGMPRASAPLSDILDGHDYFDRSSPTYANDSMSTFWTPFQPAMSPGSGGSRAYSPTTSLTNLSTTFSSQHHHTHLPSTSSVSVGRPGTSASSTETIFQHRADDEKTRFLSELRQALTSLLLSDLGSLVMSKGSETDAWFEKIGQQCIERKTAVDKRAKYKKEKREKEKEKEKERRNSARPRTLEKKKSFRDLRGADTDRLSEPSEVPSGPSSPTASDFTARQDVTDSSEFPFKRSYQRLLNMFCVHPDPYAKLKALNELENLILASLSSKGSKRPKWNRSDAGSSATGELGNFRPAQLEGTIDSLRERRTQALYSAGYGGQSRQNAETRSIMSGAGQTDAITKELQSLFRDASIRPKSLFRDLQFIASFVPASVLDRPERGNAFWNTGLAALKLKSEVCRTMMEMADEVVAAHTQHRKATNEAAVADLPPSLTGTPPPPSTSYRLEDAGKMWAITAKEGYPTAQRELGLFYMSNPEYVERTILPLSKPREVFKQTVMDKYGRGRGMSGAQPPNPPMIANEMGDKDRNVRNDPGLMCVAFHWMEAAERGGDEVATNYMRQKEFMDLN